MNMHSHFLYETGPPAEKMNITLLGNLAVAGCNASLIHLSLLASCGNLEAMRELRSISHLIPKDMLPKDKNHASVNDEG